MNTKSNVPPGKQPAKSAPDDTVTQQVDRTQPSSVHKSAFRLPAMFGKYKLIRLLGQGGMGTVFYAEDTQLNRAVAIKCPRIDRIDAATEARFAREARSAAQLDHPNICAVYDLGEYDGQPYYVMPYVEGTTLAQYLKKVKRLPERQVAGFLRKVARAVGEANSKGIVHRDLKPGNIMINQRGEPIVLDFGLARDSRGDDQHLTDTGASVGTPAYMSPEQITGASSKCPIDHRSDIYSFGVIAYEMLTGRLPFKGNNFMEQIAQTLTATPEPPRSIRHELSQSLNNLCMRCMHRDISSRFQSFDDVQRELNHFLHESKPDEQAAMHPEPAQVAATAPTVDNMSLKKEPVPIHVNENSPQRASGHAMLPPRSSRWLLIAASIGGAAIALLGVIITITNKDGSTTRIEASNASSIKIDGIDRKNVTIQDSIKNAPAQIDSTQTGESAVDLYTSGRWEWKVTGNLGPIINSSSFEDSADMTADGLTIVFSSDRPGGAGLQDIWVTNRESLDSPWSKPINLGREINTPEHEATVCVSANRGLLAFSRSRKQEGWQAIVAEKSFAPNQWTSPAFLWVTTDHQQIADISSDGLSLIIQRLGLSPPDYWSSDLFIAKRTSIDSQWTDIASFETAINTRSSETLGTLSDDGRLLIFQRGPNKGKDLWIATRPNWDTNWAPPVPMESLNTEYEESCPHLLPDGITLLFASDRPGGYGLRDIWSARLTQKN